MVSVMSVMLCGEGCQTVKRKQFKERSSRNGLKTTKTQRQDFGSYEAHLHEANGKIRKFHESQLSIIDIILRLELVVCLEVVMSLTTRSANDAASGLRQQVVVIVLGVSKPP